MAITAVHQMPAQNKMIYEAHGKRKGRDIVKTFVLGNQSENSFRIIKIPILLGGSLFCVWIEN